MGRFDVLREIESLDPERDHQPIMHLSFGYEFCWDSIRALGPPKLVANEKRQGQRTATEAAGPQVPA